MKKFFKRALVIALALILCLGTFAGCSKKTDDSGFSEAEKANMTELKIQVFDGGLGHQWAKDLARKFETAYRDVSFEEGKTGVYITLDPNKTDTHTIRQTKINNGTDYSDIYYTQESNPEFYLRNGLSLNITKYINEKVYLDNGEMADLTFDSATKKLVLKDGATAPTKSIYDKMFEIHQRDNYFSAQRLDYNKDGTADFEAGFYSLPYEDSLAGFVYDHDLFEENGWLDYTGIDGLPDNMDDFFDLLGRIVEANIIPFTFSSTQAFYYTRALEYGFIGQYEGQEGAMLNRTYDGEYTFAGDSAPTTITAENAYLLANQPSKEALIEFMRNLFDPRYVDPDCANVTSSFTETQKNFILSKNEPQGKRRIAMLFEGEWWENEAREYFTYTGGYGTRDFRFFPLPEIEGQKTDDRSVANYSNGTTLFVCSKTKHPELCGLWLQFAHSESALEAFTMTTGTSRFFEFDLDNTQLSTMSKFAQDTYKIKSGQKGVTVYSVESSSHEFFSVCPMGGYGKPIFSTTSGAFGNVGYNYEFLSKVFYDKSGVNGSTYLSADDYIAGMYNYYSETNWKNAYNNWINR